MKKILVIMLCLFAPFALMYCGEKSSTSGGGGGGGGGGGDGGISLSASVTGAVSADVISSVFNVLPDGSMAKSMTPAIQPGACASAAFNVHRVGGGGTPISSGTAGADGSFSAQTTADDEVVIDFPTCGIKCFGKPGTTGLLCDPVANAVVVALEQAIGEDVTSSNLFMDLSIAKIVEGMVETLKLLSRLDPTNDYGAKIKAANGNAATLLAIIQSSPVGTLFTTIGTLAQEKKIENQALADGSSASSAIEEAAQQSWTLAKIMDMVAGLGMEVYTGLDASTGNGPGSIYDTMFANFDSWTETDFMTQMQIYVSDLWTKQYVNKEVTAVSLLCRVYKYPDYREITYPPFYNGVNVNVTVDGATVAVKKLSCIDLSTTNNVTDAMGISSANGTVVGTDVEMNAILKPSYEETNRNDPTGKYGNDRGYNSMYLSFIDIFNEFMNAMMPGGACGSFVTMDPYFGPTGFDVGFETCIKTKDKNGADITTSGLPALNEYMAGLIGFYKFMRNPDLRSTKFSLNDLYATMISPDGMAMRLTADLYQFGIMQNWVQLMSSDPMFTGNSSIPGYMLQSSGTFDANGREIYDVVCPAPVCDESGMPKTYSVTLDDPTKAQLLTALAQTAPSFASTLGMFQQIPNMESIKNSIFKAAHHEDWNIAGSKTFWTKGVSTDENQYDAEAPILCKIVNPDAAGNFIPLSSSIECEAGTRTTWNADGYPADTAAYAGYYALQERGGGNNEGGDRYYGLMSMSTGMDYRLNGRDFRIRGIRASVASANGLNVDGTTLQSVNEQFCNNYVDSMGNMNYNCWQEMFDYVGVSFMDEWFPATSYNPFSWPVPMTDSMGNQWNMQVAISDHGSPYDFGDDFMVCIKGSDGVSTFGGVTVNMEDSQPDSQAVDGWLPYDSLDGVSYVDKCNSMTGTFYYLSLNWGATSKDTYQYTLVRNDGAWMYDPSYNTYLVSMTEIEDALNQTQLSGESAVVGGQVMGPAASSSWLNGYEVANMSHDPKYDPFCDDVNMNGICDCNDLDGDSTCTLADDITEPTISEPPYYNSGPAGAGGQGSTQAQALMDAAGGYSGDELVSNLQAAAATLGVEIGMVPANWDKIFECADDGDPLTPLPNMKYVDVWKLMDTMDPTNAKYAGEGCGTYDWMGNAGMGMMGPVRMRKLIRRDNAYDIARPNTLLKLMSTATSSTGTGVTIDPANAVFGFQDALALTILRSFFPPEIAIRINTAPFGMEPVYTTHTGMQVYFDTVQMPGKGSNPSTGLLKGFMKKAMPNL